MVDFWECSSFLKKEKEKSVWLGFSLEDRHCSRYFKQEGAQYMELIHFYNSVYVNKCKRYIFF